LACLAASAAFANTSTDAAAAAATATATADAAVAYFNEMETHLLILGSYTFFLLSLLICRFRVHRL
jgi:hypothetical protein